MKKILTILFILGVICIMEAKDLKVLMIGNSFSICVGRHLPSIVQASEGNHLTLVSLYIGGCSLQQHWDNLIKGKTDVDFKPYGCTIWDSNCPKNPTTFEANLAEMLTADKWDVITLQQASHFSWQPHTFEPYTGQLIATIHEMAPQAEVVVQQTWSYRNSDPRFTNNNGEWGIDQTEMYDRLTECYTKISADYGNLRIIPVGKAIQIWRQANPYPFHNPTAEELANCRWPDMPSQYGDVVGNYWYEKSKTSDKQELRSDNIHLNYRGEYLQACVWYLKLFGGTAADIKYIPSDMDGDFCRNCQQCAAQAVAE